jgi:hypothetical protein
MGHSPQGCPRTSSGASPQQAVGQGYHSPKSGFVDDLAKLTRYEIAVVAADRRDRPRHIDIVADALALGDLRFQDQTITTGMVVVRPYAELR